VQAISKSHRNENKKRMNTFAVYDKVKPDAENIRGLNLVVVKLTTIQVTKLPLLHKYKRHDLLCKTWTNRGLSNSAEARIFSNMPYVQYIDLIKAKPIHKGQTRPLTREDVTYELRPHHSSSG
jgi:hypothetical protein